MGKFTKTTSLSGKYKEIAIIEGNFVYPDTGEIIDLATELYNVYGDNTFSLSTSYKSDLELGGDE